MPQPGKFTVLVAHSEPVMRIGLVQLIDRSRIAKLCAEASTAATGMTLCQQLKPDALILDTDLEGGGMTLLRDVRRWMPATRVLIFARTADPLTVQRALSAGALGYVTHRDQGSEVIATLELAMKGRRHLGKDVEQAVLHEMANGKLEIQSGPESKLSARELEVFRLIGLGRTTREVAQQLHVSAKTVETHRHRIKSKLCVYNSTDLQRRAIQFCSRGTPQTDAHRVGDNFAVSENVLM
jgi:DNA-binding NarL/FixJ family response regulator